MCAPHGRECANTSVSVKAAKRRWLAVNQRLSQGTSLGFARQKQGWRWKEEERRKLERHPLLSNSAKKEAPTLLLVWLLMYLVFLFPCSVLLSHPHELLYCFSNRLQISYVLLTVILHLSAPHPLLASILKKRKEKTGLSNDQSN